MHFWRDGALTVLKNADEIRDCFTNNHLKSLGLGAQIEGMQIHVDEAQKVTFLTTYLTPPGVDSKTFITDTFVFDDEYKIRFQSTAWATFSA